MKIGSDAVPELLDTPSEWEVVYWCMAMLTICVKGIMIQPRWTMLLFADLTLRGEGSSIGA